MADLDEVDLAHARVGVAPLPADELDAVVRLQVDDRVRAAGQQLRRPRDEGGDVGRVCVSIVIASTFTTKYRNGSETSVNWCGTAAGMASTSPGDSSCACPPLTDAARNSPSPTLWTPTISPPVTTVAFPSTMCITSTVWAWYSTSPGRVAPSGVELVGAGVEQQPAGGELRPDRLAAEERRAVAAPGRLGERVRAEHGQLLVLVRG